MIEDLIKLTLLKIAGQLKSYLFIGRDLVKFNIIRRLSMSMKDKLIQSTISAFLVLIASNTAIAEDLSKEKCYGVVKKGMNDCSTATSDCAGSSTRDSQKDAFILLPKGICEKLVGGSLDMGK